MQNGLRYSRKVQQCISDTVNYRCSQSFLVLKLKSQGISVFLSLLTMGKPHTVQNNLGSVQLLWLWNSTEADDVCSSCVVDVTYVPARVTRDKQETSSVWPSRCRARRGCSLWSRRSLQRVGRTIDPRTLSLDQLPGVCHSRNAFFSQYRHWQRLIAWSLWRTYRISVVKFITARAILLLFWTHLFMWLVEVGHW